MALESSDYFPFVEVRMFTYNHEKYIADAIESVLAQEYPNFKVYIHSDGSKDSTAAIINDYAKRYPDKVISRCSDVNIGLIPTMNDAFSESNAKYMVFLSGDDLMMQHRISKQVNALLTNPNAVLCASNVETFYDDGRVDPVVQDKVFSSNPSAQDLIRSYCHVPSSSFAMDFEKFRDLRIDDRIKMVNDWLYFIEVVRRGQLVYIPEVLTRYRRHENNSTASGAARSYLDDRLISADLYLVKYSEYYFALCKNRSNSLYSHAKRLYKEKDFILARRFAFWSWIECKYNIKCIAFSLITLGGKHLYSFVMWLRKKIRLGSI